MVGHAFGVYRANTNVGNVLTFVSALSNYSMVACLCALRLAYMYIPLTALYLIR